MKHLEEMFLGQIGESRARERDLHRDRHGNHQVLEVVTSSGLEIAYGESVE